MTGKCTGMCTAFASPMKLQQIPITDSTQLQPQLPPLSLGLYQFCHRHCLWQWLPLVVQVPEVEVAGLVASTVCSHCIFQGLPTTACRHSCTSIRPAKHIACWSKWTSCLFTAQVYYTCGPPATACRRHRVLLGASGSVAAIKVVELAHLLAEFAEVKMVLTKAARHFVQHDGLPFAIHGAACSNTSNASRFLLQTDPPHCFAGCV